MCRDPNPFCVARYHPCINIRFTLVTAPLHCVKAQNSYVLIKMLPLWSVLALAVLLLTTWWYFSRPRNLPPGLPRLPIIGSLPFLSGDLRKRLTELRDSYGEVSSVYLGESLVVVLNGLNVITETFGRRGHLFSDRPRSYFRDTVSDKKGLVFSNGESWKAVRRFSLQALRDFGMGKPVMEEKMMEEIDACLKKLSEYNDKSVDLENLISNAVANVACSVILGKKFDYGDPKFVKYLNHTRGLNHAANGSGILTAFPWLKYVPWDLFGFQTGRSHNLSLMSIHQELIREHKETRSAKEQRDVLDVFADRLSQIETDPNPLYSATDLVQASVELAAAGTETTASTLRWGILYLAQHPEIQEELQYEVDEVLGTEGSPRYSMRHDLPKVEAFIHECLRLGDVFPFTIPHAPSESTTINGFTIPKGTVIMANLHGVHYDQAIWGDPDRFRPWRFLRDDGRINTELSSCVASFSVGKRSCPGEALARMELFLFSCRLLQRFTFSPPDGVDLDKVDGILATTFMPSRHKIMVRLRENVQ